MEDTQETWVQSLGWEDFLEESTETLSSILAWKIPWTEEPGELQSMGSELDTTEQLTTINISLNKEHIFFIERFLKLNCALQFSKDIYI